MRIPINGLDYYVEDDGDPDDEPILLLHGFSGGSRSWDEAAPALVKHYRVIRVDLPGHGKTEFTPALERYSMDSVAGDLSHLLQSLAASPAHALGYSMGGRLALCFALTHPRHVRTLIVESGSPGLATEGERATRRASDEALAGRIERDGIAAFVDAWERLPLWRSQTQLSDDVRRRQRELRLRNDPRGLAMSLRGMGTGAQPSLWGGMVSLQMEALLIAGALDDKFVEIAREMQARTPQASLAVIQDAGHATHLERPAAFVEAVTAFLRS